MSDRSDQSQTVGKHLFIDGRVQGVFFRASTQNKAQSLGVQGWVRNLADGRVEVMAWGEAEAVERLVQWCHHGPPHARVTDVRVEDAQPRSGASGFNIRHT